MITEEEWQVKRENIKKNVDKLVVIVKQNPDGLKASETIDLLMLLHHFDEEEAKDVIKQALDRGAIRFNGSFKICPIDPNNPPMVL